jgi:hypothetical protein
MKPLPCPACEQPLTRKTIRRSTTEFNTEGKRWYQYAGPRIFCKHCGVRLRGPWHAAEKWLLWVWLGPILANALVIQPLAKRYGLTALGLFFVVIGVSCVYLVLRAQKKGDYRYVRWDDPPS